MRSQVQKGTRNVGYVTTSAQRLSERPSRATTVLSGRNRSDDEDRHRLSHSRIGVQQPARVDPRHIRKLSLEQDGVRGELTRALEYLRARVHLRRHPARG